MLHIVDIPAQLSPSCSAMTAIFNSVLSMALSDAANTSYNLLSNA